MLEEKSDAKAGWVVVIAPGDRLSSKTVQTIKVKEKL